MADFPNRNSLHIPRSRHNVSRNPSARSSALYEDHRQPSIGHSLRPADSRFSLNEHFAASRREYEFGDDDASSIFDRATLASDAGDGLGDQDIISGDADGVEDLQLDGDCYDLLCLPRDTDLTQDQIRQAYYRMFLLFYPDNYTESQRPMALQYFNSVQEAFETLIDPERRAIYNLGHDTEDYDSAETDLHGTTLQGCLPKYVRHGTSISSDIGIRFNTTDGMPWRRNKSNRKNKASVRPLDFALSHSVAVRLPAWQRGIKRTWPHRNTAMAATDEKFAMRVDTPCPTLVLSGSVYGIVEDMSRMPITLLSDRYQPLLPATSPGYHIVRLADKKSSPFVSVMVRQEFLHRSFNPSPDCVRWIGSSVEVASDILPVPSFTTRVSHKIALPNTNEPTTLDTTIGSSTFSSRRLPRLTLGARHNFRYGTAFIHADSGDWTLGSGQTCRFFSEFSKLSRKLSIVELPLTTTPSLEVGVTTGPPERSSLSYYLDSIRGRRGMEGLDQELGVNRGGSWAVSASASFNALAGFLRYSRDFAGVFWGSPTRLEAELCSNIFRDRYIALRSLWSLGSLSRLGLEAGISTHNIHLSIYWSRLNQRITVPVLISQHTLLSPKLLFWASIFPIISFAVPSFILHRRTRSPPDQYSIARHRHHADTITALITPSIDALQKHRASQGGIVILSAKFGVKDEHGGWAGEEVADVTVAVAALVPADGGGLVIPGGARKGRLPGFWDPASGMEKVLHVRYACRGREVVVEVRGKDELALPSRTEESRTIETV